MNFEKMVSNQTTVQTLKKAAQSGKLSHAYLLHGTVGTGKKTLAHIFSEAILCRGLAEKPCGECLPCKKAEKEIHPDIMIVRKPEGKSGILVEQVRQLRQDVYTRPNESDYRIVIIEESETMNLSAANALLKVLEEPPPYLVFVLTANNISALPETIASRCLCLEMQEVSLPQAQKWLLDSYPNAELEAIQEALAFGNGNLGRSRRFMEEESCRGAYQRAMHLAKSLTREREYDILEVLSVFDGNKEGFLQMLSDFDRIMGQIAVSGFIDTDIYTDLSQKILPLTTVKIHDLIDEIRQKIQYNGNMNLLVNLFCAQLKTIMEVQG